MMMDTERPTYQKEVSDFEQAVSNLRGRLLQVACSYLNDEAAAEDAVQDALMRCWIARQRIGNMNALPNVAMRTLKNLCIDYLRNKKDLADCAIEDKAAAADVQLIGQEQQAWMLECLRSLPHSFRAVLQMKGIDALSYQEIATILGTTEATVRAKVAKARQQLWQLYNKKR